MGSGLVCGETIHEIKEFSKPLGVLLSLILFLIFAYLHLHVSLWVCAHELGSHRGQERVSSALELEFQEGGSCLRWVLGVELGSSARVASALNY